MRRRQPTKDAPDQQQQDEKAEPLDESEQNQIVESLEKEAVQGIRQMNFVLMILCRVGILVTIVVVALESRTATNRPSLLGHGMFACAMFGFAEKLCAITKKDGFIQISVLVHWIIPLVMAVAPVAYLAYEHVQTLDPRVHEELHWGLAVANLVAIGVSLLVRWDSQSTLRVLSELNAAKYRFKSI